jgi:hypothetical protein
MRWKNMETLDSEKSEKSRKKQDEKNPLLVLDELGKEIDILSEEKNSLLDIERKLEKEIDKEVKRREQKRKLLKNEVDNLKKKCEKLTFFVNNFRQEEAVKT